MDLTGQPSYNEAMASKSTTKSPAAKGGFQQRDNSGSLFYDVPGAPTMSGTVTMGGKTHKITAEPAVDKNTKSYLKIVGDEVSGGLWENENVQNERSPDYRGPIKIGGQDKRVSAWKKAAQSGQNVGQEFLSLAVSDPLPPRE